MTLDEAPAVKYVVWRTAGNPDARVIEQLNHNLDVINDIAPEGMFSIAKKTKSYAALARGLPVRPSRPDAAVGHHQQQGQAARQSRRALGAGAADRHPCGGDELLSRRRRPFGPRRAADGFRAGGLLRAAAGLADQLRARYRQAEDQALRSDDRRPDRQARAADHGATTSPPTRTSCIACSASAGGSRTRRRRPSFSRRPASTSRATSG